MQNGELIGVHKIIASDDFLGIKVILTNFGLHLVGKNNILLASSLSELDRSRPLGVLSNRAGDLMVAFVNRDYKHFTHVYHAQVIKKGA